MRDGLDFPVGELALTPRCAPIAAVADRAGHRRARRAATRRAAPGRISPIRAVLGTEGLRAAPRPSGARSPACVLIGPAWPAPSGSAPPTRPRRRGRAAGIGGTIAIFFGIALVAPFVIAPLARRALVAAAQAARRSRAASPPTRRAPTPAAPRRPRPALMIGLALVVARQQPRRQLPQLDRGGVRPELRPRPDRAAARLRARAGAAADDRRRTSRDRLAKIPEAGVVARERLLFVARPARRREGKREIRRAAVRLRPREYVPRSTRPRSMAAARRARRSSTGSSAARSRSGEGYADEDGARGRGHDDARGPVRDRADARSRASSRPSSPAARRSGCRWRRCEKVYGVTADSELALKATSRRRPATLERKVEADRRARLPEPRRALQRRGQVRHRGPGQPAVRRSSTRSSASRSSPACSGSSTRSRCR